LTLGCMRLIHGEHDGFADFYSRVRCASVRNTSRMTRLRASVRAFRSMSCIFKLSSYSVNDRCPAGFIERLRSNIGTEIENFLRTQNVVNSQPDAGDSQSKGQSAWLARDANIVLNGADIKCLHTTRNILHDPNVILERF
jgi:hypothetical protein